MRFHVCETDGQRVTFHLDIAVNEQDERVVAIGIFADVRQHRPDGEVVPTSEAKISIGLEDIGLREPGGEVIGAVVA